MLKNWKTKILKKTTKNEKNATKAKVSIVVVLRAPTFLHCSLYLKMVKFNFEEEEIKVDYINHKHNFFSMIFSSYT